MYLLLWPIAIAYILDSAASEFRYPPQTALCAAGRAILLLMRLLLLKCVPLTHVLLVLLLLTESDLSGSASCAAAFV